MIVIKNLKPTVYQFNSHNRMQVEQIANACQKIDEFLNGGYETLELINDYLNPLAKAKLTVENHFEYDKPYTEEEVYNHLEDNEVEELLGEDILEFYNNPVQELISEFIQGPPDYEITKVLRSYPTEELHNQITQAREFLHSNEGSEIYEAMEREELHTFFRQISEMKRLMDITKVFYEINIQPNKSRRK